jgi:hypothetical protein
MPFALTQHSIFSRPILIRIREYEWPASSSLRTRAQDTGVRAPLLDGTQFQAWTLMKNFD